MSSRLFTKTVQGFAKTPNLKKKLEGTKNLNEIYKLLSPTLSTRNQNRLQTMITNQKNRKMYNLLKYASSKNQKKAGELIRNRKLSELYPLLSVQMNRNRGLVIKLNQKRRNQLANNLEKLTGVNPERKRPYYNSSVTLLRNNNAGNLIQRTFNTHPINMYSMMRPYKVCAGGVNPNYARRHMNMNPIKYAMTRPNGRLYGMALLRNEPNGVRYLDILSGFRSYGGTLLNKIKDNAANSRRKMIRLKATIPDDPNCIKNRTKLVEFYEAHGFVRNGNPIWEEGSELQPMFYMVPQTLKRKRSPGNLITVRNR